MDITADERQLIRLLVQKEKDSLDAEGRTVILEENPGFLAAEERYDEFLERLLKKL